MGEVAISDNDKNTPREPLSLFWLATLVYAIMAALGLGLSYFFHNNFAQNFAIPTAHLDILRLAGIGFLSAGVLLILGYFFEEFFSSFKLLKDYVYALLGPISIPMVCYLALVSAFGEELLFRAAIQPWLGLVLTGVLFGFLHIGPEGKISSWSLWAVLAGLLMGWTYEETKSLWPPILTHFTVNFVSLYKIHNLSSSKEFSPEEKPPTPQDEEGGD